MNKFYLHSLPQPHHLSVGAVLFNENYEICVHHFFKKDVPGQLHFLADFLDEIWHLMRESVEGNEALHEVVLRGIHEEFGATGIVEKYLGPKLDTIRTPTKTFEKLTLYHAVRLKELGERPLVDEESKTKMEWYCPEDLITLYTEQSKRTSRPELDERIIIERFIDAYSLR